MALDREDWGACRECGATIRDGSAVMVIQQEGAQRRSVTLCEDCATIQCSGCGSPVSLETAFDAERRGSTQWIECSRCEDEVGLDAAVELRQKSDPNYSKRICSDCLGEITVPSGYTVVRDVSPQ